MINIEKAELGLREQLKAVTDKSKAAVTEGIADKDFVTAQELLAEATVQTHLAVMKAMNAGIGNQAIAAAIGVFVGSICASTENSFSKRDARIMYEQVDVTISDIRKGGNGVEGQSVNFEYQARDEK
jgi:hypothetical protein